MSVRVLGQDDIHGMGLIKCLHHLDPIAQRAREEHGVVDGSPSQQPSLIAMAVPDASTWGVIGSGATAPMAEDV